MFLPIQYSESIVRRVQAPLHESKNVKRPLVLDDTETVREATKRAKVISQTVDMDDTPDNLPPELDVRRLSDHDGSVFLINVAVFARQSLAKRRAALWGNKCAFPECKEVFDADFHMSSYNMVLCTTCRMFRYCSFACRGKHMYHSYNGCHSSAGFRVSDKTRVIHVLMGDGPALEQTLRPGTLNSERNPVIRLGSDSTMPLLELAAYTGDVHIVACLLQHTSQTPFSMTYPRPICASVALKCRHIDALVAMFSSPADLALIHSTTTPRTGCKDITDIDVASGTRILYLLLQATKHKNFPGAVSLTQESKAKTRDYGYSGARVTGPDVVLTDAFYCQRRQIIELFWQLLDTKIPFNTVMHPTAALLVQDALALWAHYRDILQYEHALEYLIASDRDRRKHMPTSVLFSLIPSTSPELLQLCLQSGFYFAGNIDAQVPTSGAVAAFMPVVSKHISDNGWSHREPNFQRNGHDIIQSAWSTFSDTATNTPDLLQWLASQGAEFSETLLRQWGANPKDIYYYLRGKYQEIQRIRNGFDALASGFRSYLTMVNTILHDFIRCLPTAIIQHIILKYLVQGELVDLIGVIQAQLPTTDPLVPVQMVQDLLIIDIGTLDTGL